MEDFKIILFDNKTGELQLYIGNDKAGKMNFSISDNKLTVYHTEVDDKYEGRGFGKMLLKQLVDYAQKNNLKIIPVCPYVYAQFKRHPEIYRDVWHKKIV